MNLQYFGLLSIACAWLLVVAPALWLRIDVKNQNITAATRHPHVGWLTSFGLVLGACFQTLFLVHLMCETVSTPLSLGPLLFLSCNLATVLVAIFSEAKYPWLHQFFTRYYFVMIPMAQILVTPHIAFSVVLAAIYFLGIGIIRRRYHTENALIELWSFIVLSIWTIVITFV